MVQTFSLHVQPPPQKLLPEHAQTLERYAWESFDPHSQGEYTQTYSSPNPVNYAYASFYWQSRNRVMSPVSDICKRSSCCLLQWPSCLRMFSCCCSQSWWVSSSTYWHSSQDFLILPISYRKNCLHVAVMNSLEFILFGQWDDLSFLYLQYL